MTPTKKAHAKVNLKLAKMQRRKAWIFCEPRPAAEKTQRNVRGIIATYVEIHADLHDEGFDPERLDDAGRTAWVESMVRRHRMEKVRLLAEVETHFEDEATDLRELVDGALDSPHVLYLRLALDTHPYAVKQLYRQGIRKALLSAFVFGDGEEGTP